MKIIQRHKLFITVILIVFSTRLLVFNQYAGDFWGDERHYRELIAKLEESSAEKNLMIAVHKIFNLNARPGLGLFYYPAAFLEWKNSGFPFGLYFNLIINTLSVMLVYLIVKKTINKGAAFLATVLAAFSMASLVYIRHLIPYDIALFSFLSGWYIYVYFNRIFVFGLFTGLAFLTYPGYYYYFLPLPFILLLQGRSLRKTLIFVIGAGAILLFTQVFSLLLGETTSYFRSLKIESAGAATANYGEFIPAVSYIGEYIFAVDGVWNIVLIAAIFPAIFLIKDKRKYLALFIYLMLMFLIMEAVSHILQKTVLFGRTVRPLYLLALIFSALVLEGLFNSLRSRKYYIIGISILILGSFLNWLPKYLTYQNLTYPKEFQQKANVYLSSGKENEKAEEAIFVNYWDTKDPLPGFYKSAKPGKFYIVNAVQMFPYFGNYSLDRFCDNEVLLKERHIQYIFRPYLFEGHKRLMREKMDEDPLYYYLIYCKT